MSFEDEVREKMYLQNLLLSKNDADFQRRMQNTDKTINFIKDVGSAIGNSLISKPAPPPPPSGGNLVGKVLAGAAIAGGAFLLSKLFGGSDNEQKVSEIDYDKGQSCFQAANEYYYGYDSREVNKEKAIELYKKAANFGNKSAKLQLKNLGKITEI